jgi:hypothetical protein
VIHIANILILISLSVRDILWLRVFSILAGFFFIAFYALHVTDPEAPITWNVVFMTVNSWHISRLFLERRPVHLSDPVARLHQLAFRSLTPVEMTKLVSVGSWEDAAKGDALCVAGEPLDKLAVLATGRVEVVRGGGEPVAVLEAGQLVGELSYLTGEVPTADVRAQEPTRYLAWERTRLTEFLGGEPKLRGAFQRVLGADVAHKLRGL